MSHSFKLLSGSYCSGALVSDHVKKTRCWFDNEQKICKIEQVTKYDTVLRYMFGSVQIR